MPLNYTRTYWKQRVGPELCEKVRQQARQIDPTGAILNEDADCVRIIAPKDVINAIETACGIGDAAYWAESAKPLDGTVLDLKKPAAAPAPAAPPAP